MNVTEICSQYEFNQNVCLPSYFCEAITFNRVSTLSEELSCEENNWTTLRSNKLNTIHLNEYKPRQVGAVRKIPDVVIGPIMLV